MSELRIVSLVPSLTELAVALGLGGRLVGRTGFCIHPREEVQDIPKLGGTKDPDLERLAALAPTHVLLNQDENRLETFEALRRLGATLVITHPCAPADNLALLDQFVDAFGAVPGVAGRARALRDDIEHELALTTGRAWPTRQALYLIWRGPWMTVARGTYISRMLACVGWQTLPAQHGGPLGAARYPVVEADAPWLGDVDELLLSSEPYRFRERHIAEAQALAPKARVRLVDGELLSWYGPRAGRGLAYLRELASA
ncbi:helical backbone metal receptor [Caldimonas sp. KR1-144]|uniref:helical backbone metal receptor n=1 Tax=Caldimonas sp. KR1-144 TaxID=3400911 RepID=UPI003C069C68